MGDRYIDRNQKQRTIAANTNLFSKVFRRTRGVESIIEFGANIGLNQKAIKNLKPDARRVAVEINERAAEILGQEIGAENVINESILELDLKEQFDMSFIKGVLIHINPNELQSVYEKLYNASKRYIAYYRIFQSITSNYSLQRTPVIVYSNEIFREKLWINIQI